MLNPWFASKDHDKTNDIPSSNPINTNTIDGPNESLITSHRTSIGFTSPHDDILAHMRGQPHAEPVEDGLLHEEVLVSRKEEQNIVLAATPQGPTVEKELVYDPFEGTPIGFLITPQSESFDLTQQVSPSSSRIADAGGKLEQWEHLSQVLDLQNELAKMHLEMEGVGIGDGKGKAAGRVRGRGKGKGDANWERNQGDLAKEWKSQRQTTTDTIAADIHEGDEEGVDAAGNEEIEMKKAREERFSNMADHFESRKEVVQAIMSKLDHLSKALTQFHNFQAPDIEFSKNGTRQNSTILPDVTSKIAPPVSDTLPNAGPSNISEAHHLRRALSSIPSSHGSLSSAPQATLAPEAENVLPALLSKGNFVKEPVYVNEMEPGKQMHVMDSPDSIKGSVKLPP